MKKGAWILSPIALIARLAIFGMSCPAASETITVADQSATESEFRFSLPDLDGNLVSSTDPRFDKKVVLVDVWGSW